MNPLENTWVLSEYACLIFQATVLGHLVANLFIDKILAKLLTCARHCARNWEAKIHQVLLKRVPNIDFNSDIISDPWHYYHCLRITEMSVFPTLKRYRNLL